MNEGTTMTETEQAHACPTCGSGNPTIHADSDCHDPFHPFPPEAVVELRNVIADFQSDNMTRLRAIPGTNHGQLALARSLLASGWLGKRVGNARQEGIDSGKRIGGGDLLADAERRATEADAAADAAEARVRELLASRDRYRLAWMSARRRAREWATLYRGGSTDRRGIEALIASEPVRVHTATENEVVETGRGLVALQPGDTVTVAVNPIEDPDPEPPPRQSGAKSSPVTITEERHRPPGKVSVLTGDEGPAVCPIHEQTTCSPEDNGCDKPEQIRLGRRLAEDGDWRPGSPCVSCGGKGTFGEPGKAGCRCGRWDDPEAVS